MTSVSLDRGSNIKVDAAVGAQTKVVDTADAPRQAALRAAFKGDVDACPLRRDLAALPVRMASMLTPKSVTPVVFKIYVFFRPSWRILAPVF